MDFKIIALLALLWAPAAQALTYSQIRYHLEANGYSAGDVRIVTRGDKAQVYRWTLPIPAPEAAVLPNAAACDAIFGVPAKYRKIVAKQILEMDAGEKAAVDAAELAAEQARLEARQATKAQKLKKAEKRVIKFLRAEAAIATNATSVTQAQLADYLEALELLPGSQGDNKAAKLERLLRAARLNGGSEDDLYFHTDVSE